MSVLRSMYYEELPDLNRYGENDRDGVVEVHVAAAFLEHIHISIEQRGEAYAEVNMTIETAEAILVGLQTAIASARKGRELRRD